MSTVANSLRSDAKVIGLVSVAHLISHFFHLVAAPFLVVLKDEFGVSFAALGFAVSAYYVVSGFLQTPAGFLVDRLGGKTVLVGGLVLGSIGTAIIGLAPSYAWVVLGFIVAGAGNSAFHPADMAILNAKVEPRRLGPAFSMHGVGGSLGWVAAPVFGTVAGNALGWRGALVLAGAIGLAAALVIAAQRELYMERPAQRAHAEGDSLAANLKLLAAPEVLLCFAFFAALCVALVATQTFSVATMISLYGVQQAPASAILTAYLLGGTAGIFAGGFVAMRFPRHGLTTVAGVAVAMVFVFLLATGALALPMLAVAMTVAGFFLGAVGPSRDIIIREVTPVHARGKVYGFVYSGLDLGAAIAPAIYGWFLDDGQPRLVFLGAGLALLLCVVILTRLACWKDM
ncbi:MAG: MFS transporter [Betaproteobacteria bacterium]|nr:MFS transporter [Betaproteobacteria bacterium]